MEDKKETFTYSYSAQQQEEIEKIREKYLPRAESKMDQLRRLDQSVTKPGRIVSILVGVVSVLIMGFGMSCTMVWADSMFIPGVVIGLIGIVGLLLDLPLKNAITKRQREKLAPQIMKLSEELMQQK